ncbi:MAG: hypothetical protein ACFCUU_03520 [Cyclobacteriaceae bacterium]
MKDKDKLLLQLLRKNPEMVHKIYYEQVEGKEGINDLIAHLKNEISAIKMEGSCKRGIIQKNLAIGIGISSKDIGQYTKIPSKSEERSENESPKMYSKLCIS